MAGRIPPEFINQLLERVNIVELIHSRVPLKKAGHEYVARCPFHNEKTPSFTVSPSKQFYHCFGCGAHGSAINFLMEYEHLPFIEAITNLATSAGLELPNTFDAIQNTALQALVTAQKANYAILERVDLWFRQQLRGNAAAQRAVNYLKSRSVTGTIANTYGLGYAPPGGNELAQALGKNSDAVKLLLDNGLIVADPDCNYDRFRDRIMFPIRDHRGRTIGFGGRAIGDIKPKYLNSPNTLLFHKSKELYGLFEAQKALTNIEQLLVVEGYLDVIALAEYAIHNVVAILGSAVNANHLEHLFKVCPSIVFCLDGDGAGREAAWRAAELALTMARDGREIKFLFIPEGDDPDTLVRRVGTAAMQDLILTAKPLSEFVFERLSIGINLQSIDGRARFAELAKVVIKPMPEGIYKNMMVDWLTNLTGLSGPRLGLRPQSASIPNRCIVNNALPLSLVQRAAAMLLQYPDFISLIQGAVPNWQRLNQPGSDILEAVVAILMEYPHLSTAALTERWRDSPQFEQVLGLASYKFEVSEFDLQAEFSAAMQRLRSLSLGQNMGLPGNLPAPSDLTPEQKQQIIDMLARNR
ncbi:hypothetical protein TI04_06695 [Achromatium sp. WMS2]|nr:hypothetical protein TI04_06695 [Achromatium sp. WMS2]